MSAPSRSVWVFRSFVENTARRLGHHATNQDAIEIVLAEFQTTVPPTTWKRVVRRRQWPPAFVTDVDPRSHNARPHPVDSGPWSISKDFEFRGDGISVETPGPWFAYWKTQAERLGIPEPMPGDPTWADYYGIIEDQTDGQSFVMSRPPICSDHRRPVRERSGSRELRQALHLRKRRELDRAARELYGRDSIAEVSTAEGAGSNAPIADNPIAGGSLTKAPIASASATEREPSDALSLVVRFREVETTRRVLTQKIRRCLSQIRDDQSWREVGFHSFEDYVESRLGITYRTANQWIRTLQGSGVLLDAETDGTLRSSALLTLVRIQKAGASEECLGFWIEHATTVTVKILERQVRWALAHEELQPRVGPLVGGRMHLAPPSESHWQTISASLLATPSAISCVDFHTAMAKLSRDPNEAEDLLRKISARSASKDDAGNPFTHGASSESGDRKISARDASKDDAGSPLTNGASSEDETRKISARLTASPTVHIPDPREDATSKLFLDLQPETAEQLARTLALIRGAYGEDKPDWWCLEVLLLHVQAGWSPQDQDFRRRTAEFAIHTRDGFQCTVPVCTSRRELMVHHIVYRSAGGSDDPENKTSICSACHLQGIHEQGTISVTGQAPDDLKWRLGQTKSSPGVSR